MSAGTSFELKAGTVHVDASFGGLNAGDVDLGLSESAAMKISGGTLMIDNNLDFTAGLLEITGTEGSVGIGGSLNLGTGAGSETELSFVLGETGGVSTVFADDSSLFTVRSASGHLVWDGVAGRNYSVWYSSNLVSGGWGVVSNIGAFASDQQIDIQPGVPGFYRISVER